MMAKGNSSRAAGAAVRCAIYTRKSSDEGLEQEFNSLDAQREASEAYIVSQRHAGWIALPDTYDDGGLSGGSMDRPALQRLLADVKNGKVQIIVVYKVDRLTRSLADFAKIVDVLDAHDASFVSVTQQFNTTTSMGRLTLNMLLSFAQFEREIAGERIRDKIAASKRKGMWMGGNVPLGYDVKDRKLVANEAEASTVRKIFERYVELGSVALLRGELDARGIVSKRREGAQGAISGGKPFSRGALYLMLQNRLYRGEIAHQGSVYPGQHAPIVEEGLWQLAQEKLTDNRRDRSLQTKAEAPSLLSGLVYDAEGERMTPTHANKGSKRYRYYVSASLIVKEGKAGDTTPSSRSAAMRVPAGDLEALTIDRLRAFLVAQHELAGVLDAAGLDAKSFEQALKDAAVLAQSCQTKPREEMTALVRAIIDRVVVTKDRLAIEISTEGLLAALGATPAPEHRHHRHGELVTLTFEMALRRAGKEKRLVIVGHGTDSHTNPALIALIAKAFAIRDELFSGSDPSVEAMTERLRVAKGYVASLLRLSYLAPAIVREILDGQPLDLTPTRLLKLSKDLPHGWLEQRHYLGSSG
jgi:site-specific DNA recombinase